MQGPNYYKCTACGYEFLSSANTPSCPHCKAQTLDKMDVAKLMGFDE